MDWIKTEGHNYKQASGWLLQQIQNSAPPIFSVFVLLLIVSFRLRHDMATDKDLLTTTAERHIRFSATVVDRVTSSEAMNRHPNPIRYVITASSFVQLHCSCPPLNALFWLFCASNNVWMVFFLPILHPVKWGSIASDAPPAEERPC